MRIAGVTLIVMSALVVLAGCGGGEAQADLVIQGASVIDGGNRPPRIANVYIRGDRIVAVDEAERPADGKIDGRGLVLAPGFIDLHSHADLILLADTGTQERLLEAKIRQGVTTVVVGNCGLGAAPANDRAAALLAGINAWMTPTGVAAEPGSVEDYLGTLERRGVVLNVGTLVPHGPLRISTMGLSPGSPTPRQLEEMRNAVADGLDAGAFGMSTGLIYPPGMFSDTAELIELARVVAARNRLYTSHVRGSSETLLQATRELVAVGSASGARVHHSHMEAVGAPFWADIGPMLALEDDARVAGVRITHDVFPYTRAATMMAAIFPPWSLEGGVPSLLERLADGQTRERIRREVEEHVPQWPPWREGGWPHNLVGAVGWDGIRVASVDDPAGAATVGRDLAALGVEAGLDPFDVVADLMIAQGGRVGQLVDEISGRDGETAGLERILKHGAAAVVSDAEDYGRGTPHPAHAGAFVRALRWARERPLVPLEEMVHRMTGHPAAILRLRDRGEIRPGAKADLVLFDPVAVTDRADWQSPRATAAGIEAVWINGRQVVSGGAYNGGTAGSVLRAGRR